MISVERLLYGVDQKLNKIASNQHQFISNEDKLLVLNRMQIVLIKSKVLPNQLGFDSFTLRYEDLENLVVPYEEKIVEKTTEVLDSYKTSLLTLKNKFLLPVDIMVLASKGQCTNRIINVPRIVKHSDLNVLMNNTHFNPSFDYQETLAVISSNDLIIYTDGEFTVDKIMISYLRYPKEMALEGYENIDGEITTQQDCELQDHLEDELLNLTVQELQQTINS